MFLGRAGKAEVHQTSGANPSPASAPRTTVCPVQRSPNGRPRSVGRSDAAVHNRPCHVDRPRDHRIAKPGGRDRTKVGCVTETIRGKAGAKSGAVEARTVEAWATEPESLSARRAGTRERATKNAESQNPPHHVEILCEEWPSQDGPVTLGYTLVAPKWPIWYSIKRTPAPSDAPPAKSWAHPVSSTRPGAAGVRRYRR